MLFVPFPLLIRLASVLFGLVALPAAALLPPEKIPLQDFSGLTTTGTNWVIAGGFNGDPRTGPGLTPAPGQGVIINTAPGNTGAHLFSAWEHGDLVLELEYLVPPGSNSGVYLQGRYEIQILDSWGVPTPSSADAAGIYERWDAARPEGRRGYEGHPPRLGVSRAPGLWQTLYISFRAPRFDAAGNKTENARFIRVEHNGVVVHEDVEVTGPTRAAAFDDERPTGPFMLQGDHGPIAFRNLRYKHRGVHGLTGSPGQYRVYEGAFRDPAELNGLTPTRSGPADDISPTLAGTTGPHALIIEGELQVATAGTHAFSLDVNGTGYLTIGDHKVLESLGREPPALVELTAGTHPFRIEYLRNHTRGPPTLQWRAAGPGTDDLVLFSQPGRPNQRPATPALPLTIEPEAGRVRLQRTYFPFEDHKRVYAVTVGYESRLNYAYDLAQGSLLAVWTGTYLDVTDMWRARGIDQSARPTGSVIHFDGRPALAGLGNPGSAWQPNDTNLFKQRGYTLEADGQPVFHYDFSALRVSDRIAPLPGGRGLVRTLTVTGRPVSGTPWLLLAEADAITSRPGGYVIGDRQYYIDIDPEGPDRPRPELRMERGRRQLILPLGNTTEARTFRYTLIW